MSNSAACALAFSASGVVARVEGLLPSKGLKGLPAPTFGTSPSTCPFERKGRVRRGSGIGTGAAMVYTGMAGVVGGTTICGGGSY